MADMTDFTRQVKRAAVEATEAGKPVQILYGTVTKENPMEITMNQQKILDADDLILCSHLSDYEVELEMNWPVTGGEGGSITGIKKVMFKNHLRVGEKVILLRQQEGQNYVVIDRMAVMK